MRPHLSVLVFLAVAGCACANAVDNAESFAKHYQQVLFGCLIAVGVLQCLAGYKVLKTTTFLAGFVTGGTAGYFTVAELFKDSDNQQYFAFGALLLFGLMMGLLMLVILEAGIFMIGALLGMSIALVLNTAVLYKISDDHPMVVLYVALAVLGLVAGLLALKFRRPLLIVSTAFAGAYAAAVGIGHFAGSFPDPLELKRDVSTGHIEDVPKEWWIYIGGTLAAALLGIAVQFNTTEPPSDDDGDDGAGNDSYYDRPVGATAAHYHRVDDGDVEPGMRRGAGRPMQYARRNGNARNWQV